MINVKKENWLSIWYQFKSCAPGPFNKETRDENRNIAIAKNLGSLVKDPNHNTKF